MVALCIRVCCEMHQRYALFFSIHLHALDRDLRLYVALTINILYASNRFDFLLISKLDL